MKPKPSSGSVWSIVILAGFLTLALIAFLNRQWLSDQLVVWQYQPSSVVAQLVERSDMSQRGEFLFYASQPEINDKQAFNNACQNREDSAAILGCYNAGRIYIYNVSDQRLDGIKSVTAAHEMLHAAYQRLDDGARRQLNRRIDAQYQILKDDPKLKTRVALYDRIEPGERMNELHSIFGTEIGSLSPELEQHYRQYFDDRQNVVKLHRNYQAVFDDLETRAGTISAEMSDLKRQIENDSATYSRQLDRLNTDIADFNERATGGGFSSENEFVATRQQLMTRADQLDAMRSQINASIDRYNTLNKQLAAIASETQTLNSSINSSLPEAPRVQ